MEAVSQILPSQGATNHSHRQLENNLISVFNVTTHNSMRIKFGLITECGSEFQYANAYFKIRI